MSVKLLSEHNLEFLSLKGGCTGLSESKLVKMPHCWKPQAAAHLVSYHKGTLEVYLSLLPWLKVHRIIPKLRILRLTIESRPKKNIIKEDYNCNRLCDYSFFLRELSG